MTENYTDGLIFSKNIDDKGTPFTPKLVEVGVVSENGKIQCKQNVYKKNGITLISPVGLRKVSKPELLVDTNNAYFIYEDRGEVLFSEDLIGQVVVFEYYGTGNPNIGDCRVFTTVDNNGNITETLNGLLKENRKELDAIMKIGGGIVLLNKLDEVVKNAEILNIALGIKIVTGTALDLTLKETIRVGNETDKKVRDTIKVANDTDAKLNSTIATGTVLDNSLKSNITKGTEVDNKLKATIVEGEGLQGELAEDMETMRDLVDAINVSDNKVVKIEANEWVKNSTTNMYEKLWKHDMNKTTLIFEYMTLKNGKKCGYFMDYEIQDENNVKFITETNDIVFVIATCRYYTGLNTDESTLEVDKMIDGINKVVMTKDERELLKTHSSDLADKANKDDIARISSGTPLFASSVSGMTDITKNYVNTIDGYLYRYNGSAFEKTTVLYQSTGLTDDSVTPSKIYKGTIDSNLFKSTTTKDGYYLDNSGNEVALSSYCISDFIEVIEGEIYDFFAVDNTNAIISFAGGYYNSTKQFVTKISVPGISSNNKITIPTGVKYVKINTGKSKKDVTYFKKTNSTELTYELNWLALNSKNISNKIVKKIHLSDEVIALIGSGGTSETNKWLGKTANFLGDSITYGYGLTNSITDRYTALVGNILGMNVNNYGISGTKIATTPNDYNGSFTKRFISMENTADIIFVFGGTNDYGHASVNANPTAPFGTFADREDVSFYGALHVLYKGLVEKYVGKQIVVITPMHRQALVNGGGGDDLVVNPTTNKNLFDYVMAEIEVARYYGLKVLDFYSELSLTPIIPIIKTTYMPDGLHPNEAGHRLIADKIVSFMKTL